MITLIRWTFKLFKKEIRILSRYERNHPHFFVFIGLDAVISIVIVMAGFQIFAGPGSTNPFEKLLEQSGGVGMAADKLIDRVRSDDGDAYWLGPISGMRNSVNQTVDGVEVVTYIPQNVTVQDAAKLRLTVETFQSAEVYAGHVHALTGIETRKTVAETGIKIEYDSKALDSMKIVFMSRPEIVVVDYPTKQSRELLLKDAAKLTSVQ